MNNLNKSYAKKRGMSYKQQDTTNNKRKQAQMVQNFQFNSYKVVSFKKLKINKIKMVSKNIMQLTHTNNRK